MLVLLGVEVNCRQEVNYIATGSVESRLIGSSSRTIALGGTPLHLACRHGSLDAASCLLGNMAAIVPDHQGKMRHLPAKASRMKCLGWTPIHHAVYCDHVPILRLLHNKYPELLEQTTKDRFVTANRLAAHQTTLPLL